MEKVNNGIDDNNYDDWDEFFDSIEKNCRKWYYK